MGTVDSVISPFSSCEGDTRSYHLYSFEEGHLLLVTGVSGQVVSAVLSQHVW
jgi:hypothetical protein